jgi:hypothetical protein
VRERRERKRGQHGTERKLARRRSKVFKVEVEGVEEGRVQMRGPVRLHEKVREKNKRDGYLHAVFHFSSVGVLECLNTASRI